MQVLEGGRKWCVGSEEDAAAVAHPRDGMVPNGGRIVADCLRCCHGCILCCAIGALLCDAIIDSIHKVFMG